MPQLDSARRWRFAFFSLLALTVGGTLAAMQQNQPNQPPPRPAGSLVYLPNDDQRPTQGRLLALTADGRLIECERRFALRNDGWSPWRYSRQEK